MKIYGDAIWGNRLKCRYTADHLGIDYEWIATDIMQGETRTPEYLEMSPAGQVPVLELDDGRTLAQSNAIIAYLSWRLERGENAPDLMVRWLESRSWFVGDALTIADIALLAYTRLAREGGFDLSGRANVRAWIGRAEQALHL